MKSLDNYRLCRNVWQLFGERVGRGVRRGASATGAVKDGPTRRRELQKEIELSNVRREDSESELLGLQEQDAIMERLEPRVSGVALYAGEDASQECCAAQDFSVRYENPVLRHGPDLTTHRRDHSRRAVIGRIEHAEVCISS